MQGPVPAEVERLGPYLLLERLAPYGMVQPYVARRDGMIDLFVVKRLLAQLAHHPTAPQRFAREARLTRQLSNRHLVRTLDVGYAANELFLVTEFVAGVRLEVLMADAAQRGRPLPLDVVSGIAQRVLDGLAHAHEAKGPGGRPMGLVHRDLAPRSVIVAFNGEVKLGDFGVARSHWDAALTAPGTTVGTLAYMSPEQVAQDDLDARTDLYSFSVVLYELLTGGPMVDAQDALSMLRQIKDVDPPPLRARRPDLPTRLAAVVERGLAKAPRHRWPDARTYEAALQEGLQSIAPAASTERLGAFVRARLPEQEARFLELMNRVRAVSASLPSPRPAKPSYALYETEPAPPPAGEPPVEPTPEPSVMTMPGAVVPAVAGLASPRRRRASSRSVARRMWAVVAVVVSAAALLTAGAWWARLDFGEVPVRATPPPAPGGPTVAITETAAEVAVHDRGRGAGPSAGVPTRPEATQPEATRREASREAPSREVDRRSVPIRRPSPAAYDAPPGPRTAEVPSSVVRRAPSRKLAGFAARLANLRQADGDARAFDALLLDLRRAAEDTEPAVRRAVLRDLSAAERAFDVEGLAQALRRLERYGAGQ